MGKKNESQKQCSWCKVCEESSYQPMILYQAKIFFKIKMNKDIFRQTRTEKVYHQHIYSREISKGIL